MKGGEQWRDIPGMEGWYQASNFGQIRSWHSLNGQGRRKEPLTLNPFDQGGCFMVSLRPPGTGHSRMFTVASLVYMTWTGPIPPGKRVIHRSLDSSDNRSENLILGTRRTQAQRMNAIKPGAHNRRPVVKMDTDLSVVAVYSSAREAQRRNYFGDKVLMNYCNLKRKSVIAGDGYIYAWDDDAWMRRTLKRAVAELEAKGIRFTDPCTEEYYSLPPALTDGLDLEAIPWADAPAAAGGGALLRNLHSPPAER